MLASPYTWQLLQSMFLEILLRNSFNGYVKRISNTRSVRCQDQYTRTTDIQVLARMRSRIWNSVAGSSYGGGPWYHCMANMAIHKGDLSSRLPSSRRVLSHTGTMLLSACSYLVGTRQDSVPIILLVIVMILLPAPRLWKDVYYGRIENRHWLRKLGNACSVCGLTETDFWGTTVASPRIRGATLAQIGEVRLAIRHGLCLSLWGIRVFSWRT